MKRRAVDLEEVLADTIVAACKSTDKLEESDFSSWDLSDYTWQVYAGVSDAIWRHDPLSIEPVEPNLSEYMTAIYNNSSKLDIVTARLHVDGNVKLWLREHDIPYDNLVSTSQPKYELDYDEWLDDNPSMVGECSLLLRHHQHNSHVDTESHSDCERIHSLADVREASARITSFE